MSSQAHFSDSLQSLVSGMGTDRDKAASVTYVNPTQDDAQIIAAYRSSWLAKQIVNQPAEDATRKWREWQADASQISAIEASEKRLDVRAKVEVALRLAALFGRAHIYIGTDDQDLSLPLSPSRMKRGGVKFLNVLDRRYISPGEINNDSMSEAFGQPLYYSAQDGQRVHPSRFVTFYGAMQPDGWIYGLEADSDLLALMDAMKRYEGTVHNVASLVHEARLDVITIPDLSKLLSDPETERQLISRLALMRAAAGNFGTVLLNGSSSSDEQGEKWEQKNFSFATLPDVIVKAQEEVSAAARIPRAVLFGTGAGGLGATGDLELSAYYDRIHSKQSTEIEPAMRVLDECILRDALGAMPQDVWYEWRSLWQMSDKEQSEINKNTTDAINTFIGALSQAPEYMVAAMINKVTETKLLPGLEGDFNEWMASGGPDAMAELPDDNMDNQGNQI